MVEKENKKTLTIISIKQLQSIHQKQNQKQISNKSNKLFMLQTATMLQKPLEVWKRIKTILSTLWEINSPCVLDEES